MELIDRIQQHATDRPRALAIRDAASAAATAACTYAELAHRVDHLAPLLRGSFPRGAVLALQCRNCPDFVVAYLAILAAEMNVFPLAPDMALPERQRACDTAGVCGILLNEQTTSTIPFTARRATSEALAELSAHARTGDRPPQQGPGLLLQSSGTTGEPKIIRRPAAALDGMARMLVEAIGFSPADGVLTGVPLGHAYGGEHGLLGPAYGGSAVHVCNGLDLALLAHELRGGHISLLAGVPFLFEIMSKVTDLPALRTVRHAYSAGAHLPLSVQNAFRSRFGIGIGQIYGATELGSITFGDAAAIQARPTSVGYPMAGVKVHTLPRPAHDADMNIPDEHQELAIESPAMLGDVIGSHTTWRPGSPWPTGDLGYVADDGSIVLTGRLRLMIDVGGRKVNPIEVEQVLRQHPAVAEAVVLATRVSETVCRLRAVVECRPGGEAGEQAIRAFVAERLTAYKVPRVIEFCSQLPRTPLGKVLRHKVGTPA
jgi:long-chain acyl-CoA synthetase